MILGMSQRDRDRLAIILRINSGELSLRQGAVLMGISYRQSSRLLSRYRSEGADGLLHKNRGRRSNRQYSSSLKETVTDLLEKHYADYGPTLASEVL